MGIKLTGLNSGLDTESIIKELMSAHSLKLTKIENKKTKNNWSQDKWKELNKKIYALYTGDLSKARLTTSYQTKKATSSNSDCVEVTATTKAATGAHKIEINQLASAQYVTGGQTDIKSTTTKLAGDDGLGFKVGDSITIKSGTKKEATEFKVEAGSTVADFLSACKEQGLNASFDTTQKRIFLSSATSGSDQSFELTSSNENALSAGLGLGVIEFPKDIVEDGTPSLTSRTSSGMTIVNAQDAEIVLDGAKLTCSTNEPEINGLKLTLKQTTTSEASISVSNNTQAVYDMISNLVKGYNDILKAMNEAYYADSAKGYSPLTDEEKEAMTEDQIEKWESKIQDSLLRRDSTLGSLITSFKSVMSSPTYAKDKDGNILKDDKGKDIVLYPAISSLGITTSSDYSEKGLLHIQGDADDSTYSDATNKLMAMLESNPEEVCNIVQNTASRLYETMTKKMGSNTLSSALTFYNDKQMSKLDTQYDKEIETMKDKLQTLEDKYYKQFTAMETAMAKLNAQQSNLSGLLGM